MTSVKQDRPLLQHGDAYPSRLFPAPSVQQQLDPVVHGCGEPPIEKPLLADYADRGFMVFRSLFDPAEIQSFNNEIDRIRHEKGIAGRREAVTESRGSSLRALYQIHRISRLFAKLAADERIVRIVEYILGGEVYVHQSRVTLESDLHGEPDYWHSDFETWHTEDGMPRMRALSVAIMLTETTEKNGPLMLIPGSHYSFVACVGDSPDNRYKYALRQQTPGIPDDASLRHLIAEGGITAPTGPAGTVVLFDCNTMHGANSNITPCPRRNLYLAYNSLENRVIDPYYSDAPRPESRATRNEISPVKPAALKRVK